MYLPPVPIKPEGVVDRLRWRAIAEIVTSDIVSLVGSLPA